MAVRCAIFMRYVLYFGMFNEAYCFKNIIFNTDNWNVEKVKMTGSLSVFSSRSISAKAENFSQILLRLLKSRICQTFIIINSISLCILCFMCFDLVFFMKQSISCFVALPFFHKSKLCVFMLNMVENRCEQLGILVNELWNSYFV